MNEDGCIPARAQSTGCLLTGRRLEVEILLQSAHQGGVAVHVVVPVGGHPLDRVTLAGLRAHPRDRVPAERERVHMVSVCEGMCRWCVRTWESMVV